MRPLLTIALAVASAAQAADRPNILWITSEDNGKHLGCYGDAGADTPNLDALAERGVCYDNAWSNAPVCAPARTTILTGCYAPRIGAEHMRSYAHCPDWLTPYPTLLREAGYFAANPMKTDYNLAMPGGGSDRSVWDPSSGTAPWRGRPSDKPFFAVVNFTTTHESQTRKRPHTPVKDPAEVVLPPYWPDSPIIRQDWAQYYDKMAEMDRQVGEVLAKLEEDGLTDDTIVFYYSDHGPGFARCKRAMYESGLGVPMILAVPDKWKHYAPGKPGTHTDRLVAFVDLAPTALSLAGVEPPVWMDGRAFLGEHEARPKEELFGYRGRMDGRHDFCRAVRTDRWLYVRNYLIDRPAGSHNAYQWQTPLTREWERLFKAGGLPDAQADYWRNHPAEELFDLESDPESLVNLASDPAHAEALERMRDLLAAKLREAGDTGFLPEPELRARARGGAEGELLADGKYDFEWASRAADEASRLDEFGPGQFAGMLSDADSAVRYWGAMGLRFRGADAVAAAADELFERLDDSSAAVRVAAAEALARHGDADQKAAALATLIEIADDNENDFYAAVFAWNSIDHLDEAAAPIRDRLSAIDTKNPYPRKSPQNGRMRDHLVRLKTKTLDDLAVAP